MMRIPEFKKKLNQISCIAILATIGFMCGGIGEGLTADKDADAVHIRSDRLEAYQQERQVIFLGNIVATQGDLTIQGDRLTVFYSEAEAAEVDGESPVGRLERIVIEGNVRISQNNTLATGNRAVYYRSESKFVLTGAPKIQRDNDMISGSSITYFIDSEKSIVEGGPSGPVEATIFTRGQVDSLDRGSVGRADSSGREG